MEIWKDIIGFEDLYQVSNLGRIRSKNRIVNCSDKFGNTNTRIVKGRILKPGYIGKTGHQTITLSNVRAFTFPLHRLVAQAFIPNPNNLPCVNHIDEDPTNNNVENLEWCSYQYNANYGNALTKRSISRSKSVECIETGQVHFIKEWADILSVKPHTIIAHLQGRQKQVKLLHFRYLD